jgi:DNA-binding NarL/FixJ family response regulator
MNVLIVDDSELLQIRLKRELLKDYLSMCIFQAYTVKEALELFHTCSPGIIILDIDLPDGSGIDLLQIFKKEQPNIVVTMLTNFPTSEFKQSCMTFGADFFYEKSNLKGLMKTIQSLILKFSTHAL